MSKSFTLEQLAIKTGSKLVGDPKHMIDNVDDLQHATSSDVSFLANPKYIEQMKLSQAGVICIDSHQKLPEGKNYLVSKDPSTCFQQIAELLYCEDSAIPTFQSINEKAFIHSQSNIGKDTNIGPFVYVDKQVKIGNNCTIYPNVTICAHVQIGDNCIIYPGVTIREECIIGNNVILQPGVVIGSCGFGYITTERGTHQKLKQLGNVIIEDDCEIGANTTIDRARFKSTVICKGTKIDNLVQIAHNVSLGEHNIIVAQTGIAGSSSTGKYVVMGGQVGIAGHVKIGSGVQIATRSGVSKNIDKPGPYRGAPAIPLKEYNRYKVKSRKIETYVKRIEQLEKQLKSLEEKMQ